MCCVRPAPMQLPPQVLSYVQAEQLLGMTADELAKLRTGVLPDDVHEATLRAI